MTAKELMNTRFEVIADYPSSPFVVGDVIAYDGIVYGMGQPQKFIREPEKYPHIFRKMNWWENRTAEELKNYGIKGKYIELTKPMLYE